MRPLFLPPPPLPVWSDQHYYEVDSATMPTRGLRKTTPCSLDPSSRPHGRLAEGGRHTYLSLTGFLRDVSSKLGIPPFDPGVEDIG